MNEMKHFMARMNIEIKRKIYPLIYGDIIIIIFLALSILALIASFGN